MTSAEKLERRRAHNREYMRRQRMERPEEMRAQYREWHARNPDKQRVYGKTYYQRHKDKIRERQDAYDAAHKEQLTTARKRYAIEHKEHLQQRAKEWRERNKESLADKKLIYYLANKGREDTRVQHWRAKNKDRLKGYWEKWYYGNIDHARAQAGDAQNRRRSRTKTGKLTRRGWDEIKAAFGYRCAYCGVLPQRLERDHLDPLALGGAHSSANIVPACRSCNARKSARTLLLWLSA